ncbi:MAG TPA: lysophospholipid acyltransferase family protein [Woeseiaceae bacterium]|nr:lysophospholipid acyltransferase family protein [Woeseiaceae bacterium]
MTASANRKRFCRGKLVLTFLLMILGSIAILLVAVLTAFQARRFYSEQMAARLGRWSLRIWGVRVIVHDAPADTTEQRLYISNHTSTIDVFVLIGLALPGTRFFMSGFLRKFLPLGLIGYLIGIFWTVPQIYPEKRMEIFKRAESVLRRSGESVYLSPEGKRVTTGEVGAFNKGSFHLATVLCAPIVPFYIATPPEVDPGMGYCAGPGEVHVYFKPAIATAGWKLEDLVKNKERVRDLFVEWHHEYRKSPA